MNIATPLLICQIEPPQNTETGDYYYRTHAPGLSMSREESVYVINLTNEHRHKFEILEQADIVVLKNICDPDFLPVIAKRKAQGKLTVYELADDLSSIQQWNPVYFFYQDKENLDLVYRLASLCDALQVTCPELEHLYGHLNRNVIVFPNQISDVPEERPRADKEITIIGWAGSHGHLEDIEEIAPSLINWIKTRTDVRLHLMCSEPIWKLFEALPDRNKRHFPTGSIEDYYGFLAGLDIGLAPLKNTPFNRSRSDVKFLEYAVSGVVPVVQSLQPYLETVAHGKTGFVFKDSSELISILETIANAPSSVRRVASAARRYVIEHRMEAAHVKERLSFYLEQFNGRHESPSAVSCSGEHLFRTWSNLEGAVRSGRHLRLLSTKFENLLSAGLIAMQINKDEALARRLFEEAAALEPGNYLPHLFGSPVSPDPVKSLEKAIELRPDSLKALIMRGEAFSRKGKIKKSIESFERAATIFPDYEIPFRRAGELLEKMGEASQAQQLFEKASQLLIPSLAHQ